MKPTCGCHGEPMYWNKDARKPAGGSWRCAVRARELRREADRRRGVSEFGSPEYLARMSEAQCGERNARWVGDAADYGDAHRRHDKALPSECELAADSTCKGRLEVALRPDAPEERLLGAADEHYHGQMFSLDAADYARLCHSHHLRVDRGGLELAS